MEAGQPVLIAGADGGHRAPTGPLKNRAAVSVVSLVGLRRRSAGRRRLRSGIGGQPASCATVEGSPEPRLHASTAENLANVPIRRTAKKA